MSWASACTCRPQCPPHSFGDVPRSGSAGSHGNSVFNFSGNLQTVFHVGRPFYIPIKRSLSCVESGLCGAAGCLRLGLPPSERGPQPLCRRGSILESEEDQGPPPSRGTHTDPQFAHGLEANFKMHPSGRWGLRVRQAECRLDWAPPPQLGSLLQ